MPETAPPTILAEVKACRRRLEHLEALLADLPTASPRSKTFSTWQVARLLNITPTALSIWARRNGVGACRDGWRLVCREEGSGYWRWLPIEEAAEP